MKKGFTLIELLAVIVILAIIALIAVPIVLNIINDSKESSLLRSAEFYLDAVEYTIADAFLYHGGLSNGEYPITPTGDICKKALPCDDANTLKVEVNGDKPTGGSITIDSGKVKEPIIVFDDKVASMTNNGLVLSNNIQICTKKFGSEYAVGSKYECEVKPGTKYNFYVLSHNEDSTVNLIMERNICSDGDVATPDKKCIIDYDDRIEYLNETTKVWSNLPKVNESIDSNYPNLKTRLITYEEATSVGCAQDAGTCPSFVDSFDWGGEDGDYYMYGHYLLYQDDYEENGYIYVNYDCIGEGALRGGYDSGIRPVITIFKHHM